jgi:protein-histidine pros-kinase
MKDILSGCLARENTVLDNLKVLDAQGAVLWSGPPAAKGSSRNETDPTTSSATQGNIRHQLSMRLPIELDGKQVGTLEARINILGAAFRCQPKAGSTYKSLCMLLSGAGEVIYGNDAVAKPRQVVCALRDADASKETVRDMDLLAYVSGRCITAGASGLVEAVRQEGHVEELVAFAPINLGGRRFGLVMGSPRADVSVPIASHERVTYALIVALALLYFATGYTAYRSERAHAQLEQQRRRSAEEASRAKGDFLAKMSHELRTPMNGIISMTELAMGSGDAADRQKYLRVVRECADSLLCVINDVLDMSKIEAGRLELCHVPFNVPECVANTLASLAPLAKDKGLSLSWEIDPGVPPVVYGDPGRLRQVFNNLIGNAIKYTGSGEVVVRVVPQTVKHDQVELRFDVRDTGPGMSPDNLKRVFNPYYQCPDAKAYRKDSTGLGLAIAKQLVERMGGRFSVASEIGKGTVFAFTAKFGSATGEALASGKATLPSLGNVRVLVISSVEANLLRFSRLVGAWTARTDCAASADDGLLALKEATDRADPFDLVLVDNSDPSSDAFAFAEKVSAMNGCEEVALAVIYPAGLRGDAVQCLHTGIDAYLGTPVDDDQLHTTLRMAIQHAACQKGRSLVTRYSSPDSPGRKILLVEDNPVNQQAASLLLGQWGYQVHSVGSGEEALSVLADREFDLVLMDLEMPGINGIEATVQIRQREKESGRHTPIIAMTAHAMDSDRERCLAAGMDAYTSKPFRPDQLRSLIARTASGAAGGPAPSAPPAVAPTTHKDEPVWDFSEALRLADGSRKVVSVIINAFLKDLHDTLPAAQSAAMAQDAKCLAGLAHRWKGSLGLLGARRALSCAVKLEETCRLGEPERLLESFQRLHNELLVVERALSNAEQEIIPCKS